MQKAATLLLLVTGCATGAAPGGGGAGPRPLAQPAVPAETQPPVVPKANAVSPTAPKSPVSAPVATASLYDRLGGKAAITAVVEDFLGRVARDERINAHFTNADIPRLRLLLIDFVCQATGGPCKYTGKDMAILRKICDGLHAAHTARTADGAPLGLVHRDVKSGNVFVARNGVVKVGDFGIALAHHASRTSRTEIGMVKGTPGYMAPEHRLGQPVDGRADLYGVGAIAYELLSGTHINLDFATLALKGKAGWPHLAPLAQFRSDIWPDLEAVVFCALAYDAEARFADCGVLELVLEQIARRNPPIASDKAIAQWIDSVLVADVGPSQATPPPRPRVQGS